MVKAVAIFPERKEVQVVEHEEPQITQPTQVKLRMLEVGVCGTDNHICTSRFVTPPAGYEYLILGHESLGEVVEVGSAVSTLKPGDLAVPVVRRPCPFSDCRACRVGRQDFCYTGEFTERGIKASHGFMAEYVVDEERYMHFIPPTLRDVAVLVEPLTIAEKAFSEVWQVQQRLPWLLPDAPAQEPGRGLKALVLGAGPIGLLGAMALVAAGFETYVYSRSQAPNPKAAIAEAIGASYISSSTVAPQELAARIGRIDLVYEALNAEPLAFEVMKLLSQNGVFVFTSGPRPAGVDAAAAMRGLIGKNLLIFGTVNAGPDDFVSAIRNLGVFMGRWPDALRSLITGRHALEDAQNVLLGKVGGIKNVIVL